MFVVAYQFRLEDVEAVGAAEEHPTVPATELGAEVEVVTLEPVRDVVILHAAGRRIQAGEAAARAEPQVVLVVPEDTVDHGARQPVGAEIRTERGLVGAPVHRVPVVQSAVLGADPEPPAAVLVDRPGHVAAQAGRVVRVVTVVRKRLAPSVVAAQSRAIGADPEHPGLVFVQRQHAVAAQTGLVGRVVPVVHEAAAGLVEPVEPAAVGTYPDRAEPIPGDHGHPLPAQTPRVVRIVPEVGEPAGGRVEPVESVLAGADPELVASVHEQRHDPVVRQASTVVRVVTEVRHLIRRRVEPAQPTP